MQPNPNAGSMNFRRSQEDWQREAQNLRQEWQQNAYRPPSTRPPVVEAAVAGAQMNAAANRPTLPPGPPVVQTPPKAAPTLYEPFTPQPAATPVGSYGSATPAPKPAAPTQSPFTQAVVAGAQMNAASRPQPPAPVAPQSTLSDQFSPQAMGVPSAIPLGSLTKPGPSNVSPPPVATPATPRSSFADQMNGFQNDLMVQTASGPGDPGPGAPAKTFTGAENRTLLNKADAALRSTPTTVPPALRPPPGFEGKEMGKIYRDGNSFSGWGDPNGAAKEQALLLNAAKTGDMTGLSGLQQRQAMMLRDGGEFDSYGNIRTREVKEFLDRTAAARKSSAEQDMLKRRPGELSRDYRIRVEAMVSRANKDADSTTMRRGQDMDLEGKIRPKQMEIELAQAQRQRLTDTLRGSQVLGKDGKPTGQIDYSRAMQSALANGDPATAKAISEFVQAQQQQGANVIEAQGKSADQFRKLFAGKANHLDKDGVPERTKALEEQMANEFMQANNSVLTRPPSEQAALVNTAAAEFGLRTKLNQMNEGGWASWGPTKLFGMQRPDTQFQALPDAEYFRGAKLSDAVGGIRGAITPNLEAGDRYITLRDGSTYNLGRMTAEEMQRLDSLINPPKK